MRKTVMSNPADQVAGNGLLHRRALLTSGIALAGAAGIGSSTTGAAAEPLAEADRSLSPGNPVPAYQQPSKFAKNVVRTLANPNFEPRTSQSRTPIIGSTARSRQMAFLHYRTARCQLDGTG